MASETALELDQEAAGYTRGDPVHFANFPGVWEPGRPIAVSELGFPSEDEALAAVSDLGLPLTEVSVEQGSAPMPVRENHVANEEQERAIQNAQRDGFQTHAAADQAAATAGVEWPRQKMTLAEKAAFLDSYAAGQVDEADGEVAGDLEELLG